MKWEYFISILGILGATFKWIYEYTSQLRWEKNKFLLDELEKFNNLPSTKNVHLILDWNKIVVEFEDSEMVVTDSKLFNALETHDKKDSFSNEEVKLRNLFDEYFDDLTRLIFMCQTNLLSEKNFRLFMKYWIDILSGRTNKKNKKLTEQIKKYLRFYGFVDVLKFIEK